MRGTTPPTAPAIIRIFSVGFCSPPSLSGLLEENVGSDDVISTTEGTVPVIVPVAPVAPVAPGVETRQYSSQQSIVGSLSLVTRLPPPTGEEPGYKARITYCTSLYRATVKN